ncbi:hypothetical protein BDN70DRAFT_870204, partial [Pholiota conissans]
SNSFISVDSAIPASSISLCTTSSTPNGVLCRKMRQQPMALDSARQAWMGKSARCRFMALYGVIQPAGWWVAIALDTVILGYMASGIC